MIVTHPASVELLDVLNFHSLEPFLSCLRDRKAMSVLLETSLGDIVIDLLVEAAPKLCKK